jgi:hypothetical protein
MHSQEHHLRATKQLEKECACPYGAHHLSNVVELILVHAKTGYNVAQNKQICLLLLIWP